MPESTDPRFRIAPLSRGVSSTDVERAADALLRAGDRPTIEKIRAALGGGSPNTINPLLDAWWKKLSNRLDAGPAALHRLPQSVAHVAEALWMQALDEGRQRAQLELKSTQRAATEQQQSLEVRSHVLTLREGELDARLRDRERDIEELRLQLRALNLTTRKDQATIDSQARRVRALEGALLSLKSAGASRSARKPRTTPPKVVKKAKRQTSRVSTRVSVRRVSTSRRKPKRRR
jgi:Plasmid replication region DNA-binding N-term